MLYPAALTSALLSPEVRALAYTPEVGETPASGARLELGEYAESLLGAAEPIYEDAKATKAAGIILTLMNYLYDAGVVVSGGSAMVRASETRGARSYSNQSGVALVPEDLQSRWDALDETADPTPTTPTTGAARFLAVRSLR